MIFKSMDFCKFRIPESGGRVIWEITNECNYTCSYCIFASTGRKPDNELETHKVFQTLKDLKSNGFNYIKYTGGEPFIREDMVNILFQTKKLGFECDVSTNASFITEEIAINLEQLQLEMVHISLDGHNKETHEAVRGKNSFEPTLRGLNLLTKKKVNIRIGCVIHQFNEDYLYEMIKFCQDIGVNELAFSIMEPVGRMRGKNQGLATKSIEDLCLEIEQLKAKYSSHKLKINHNLVSNLKKSSSLEVCPGGEQFLFINSIGDVSPCPWITETASQFVMGNLYQNNLDVLKNKEVYQSFRKKVNTINGSCPAEHNVDELKTVKFSRHSKVYSFTTENLEYLKNINLKDKKVLTVGGSLDQQIVCNMLGAKSITNFDINNNAYYYSLLKLNALKILTYKEFLTFFMRGEKSFNNHTYQKIKPLLDKDCQSFFQSLYHTYKNGKTLREEHLFNNLFDVKEEKIFNSYYLRSEENYLLAKKMSSNKISWIHCDILDFKSNEKYDVILLSNIADYSHKMFLGSNHAAEYKLKIVDKFYEYLNIGGHMMFAYVFDYLNEGKSEKRNILNDKNYRANLYGLNNYFEVQVKSAITELSQDSACFWRKV